MGIVVAQLAYIVDLSGSGSLFKSNHWALLQSYKRSIIVNYDASVILEAFFVFHFTHGPSLMFMEED